MSSTGGAIHQMKTTTKRLRKSGRSLIYNLFVLVPISIFIWWNAFHNALPSDAEMIAQFNAHQTEHEKLVQGYRNNRPSRTLPGSVPYEHINEIRGLMNKLEVYHLGEAQGGSGQWYPYPYSKKVLQTLRFLYVRPLEQAATNEEIIQKLQDEMPELFKQEQMPLRDIGDIVRVTSAIHLQLGSEKQPYVRGPLAYFPTRIHKGYYYFPQPPRLKDGHVMVLSLNLQDSGYRPGQRVFESLDDYPPDWAKGECVLKRINLHWFITMCRTA